jgi:hypothetical protein
MKDIIGNVYLSNSSGAFVVIRKCERPNYLVIKFLETKAEVSARKSAIIKGQVRDPMLPALFGVGYIGIGRFNSKTTHNGIKIYSRWQCMIDRCYASSRNKNNSTYSYVLVCKEWHNFQYFAQWFVENYPCDGLLYELDKDKLAVGNKIYSPDTCVFVTHKENSRISKQKKYLAKSPNGEVIEIVNMAKFCRENGLNDGHMNAVIKGSRNTHKGWTRAQ